MVGNYLDNHGIKNKTLSPEEKWMPILWHPFFTILLLCCISDEFCEMGNIFNCSIANKRHFKVIKTHSRNRYMQIHNRFCGLFKFEFSNIKIYPSHLTILVTISIIKHLIFRSFYYTTQNKTF